MDIDNERDSTIIVIFQQHSLLGDSSLPEPVSKSISLDPMGSTGAKHLCPILE